MNLNKKPSLIKTQKYLIDDFESIHLVYTIHYKNKTKENG